MANLIRWEPMGITSLRQAMDGLLEDAVVRPSRAWQAMKLDEFAVDMYQTENEVVVKAQLPGIKAEDVDISVLGDILSIKGESCEEEQVKEESYFRKEMRCGSFSRSLQIPVPVSVDGAEAVFQNGVLTLTLPKTEVVKPKQVQVKTAKEAPAAAKPVTEKSAAKPKKAKPKQSSSEKKA
ncbi:MAG: Hsp20/alpha crystallin family protein [Dehalococcoidia bacterium]|nr:Hsp20/alpha crystallin family protein [Dehalococcoidia bacterium]